MLKPEGFFSFVWGMADASPCPGFAGGGMRLGTGAGTGVVDRPPLSSVCFFLLTPASPLWGHERSYWIWRCVLYDLRGEKPG